MSPCASQTYPDCGYQVSRHPALAELLVVRSPRRPPPPPAARWLMVDALCGAAVLRGADVYAPGVLGCPAGECCPEPVSCPSLSGGLVPSCLCGRWVGTGLVLIVCGCVAAIPVHDALRACAILCLLISPSNPNIPLPCGRSAVQQGETVAVYADLDGGCLRGRTQPYQGRRRFVGNGVMQLSRRAIFTAEQPR